MPRRKTTRRRATKRTGTASKKYVRAVVRRAVRSDVHYFDNQVPNTPVADPTAPYRFANPSGFGFIAPAQGDSQQSREGKKIMLTSIHLRLTGFINSLSTSHDNMRLLLVQVKRASDSASPYSVNDIIDTTAASLGSKVAGNRRLNNGIANNFKVLRDWYIDLGYHLTDKCTFHRNYYKKFKKAIPVWFAGSTQANPVMNDIMLVGMSDVAAAGATPQLNVVSRITFIQ